MIIIIHMYLKNPKVDVDFGLTMGGRVSEVTIARSWKVPLICG